MADDALPDLLPDVAGEIDFREVPATREQKLWMVDLILNRTESAASLARKYHFSRDHLNKMVKRRLKGKSIQFKRGRPRLLDENSRVSIDSKIRNMTCTSIIELKESIDVEFKATITRRNPVIPADSDDEREEPKMSRRSSRRYIFLLHPGVFPPPALGELNMA
jgi:transposase